MPISAVGFDRWLRCAEKTCCSYYAVFPTGGEIVLIARTLGVPIDEVVAPVPSQRSRTTYRLRTGGQPFRLALVRTRGATDSSATCGFLAQLPDGTARCGLGSLRPLRCATYPNILRAGQVDVDAAGCSCRGWSIEGVDVALEATGLTAMADAYTRYAKVVAAWNALIRPAATHAMYLKYLSEAYSP